jgi:excisionase family DNA binding protein
MKRQYPLHSDQLALPLERLTVRIPTATEMTGIGRTKLYELIRSGEIETVKVGRCTLIVADSLKRLIERARHCD